MAQQVAYTNGLSLDPRVDVCGLPLLYPIQDDPVKSLLYGEVGNVEVKFYDMGNVLKGTTYTNEFGYFTVLLEEGTYTAIVDDPRYEPFSKPVTLSLGSRAPYVGYILEFAQSSGDWDDLIITPPEVRKRYLFGLILVDRFGNPYSDDDFAELIRAKTAEVEMMTDVNILYRRIWAAPQQTPPDVPGDWDIIEPGYDYDFKDLNQWLYLQLRNKPLVKPVKDFHLVYPVGLSVFKVPEEWIRSYYQSATIQVVPMAGAISRVFLTPQGQFAPLVSWYLPGQIPQVNRVSYEVGFVDENGNPNPYLPKNVFNMAREIVGKIAAIEVLGITGDAILAGIASQSISGDGISESFSTTASATSATYQARIESYRKDLDGRTQGESGLYQKFRDYWSGIPMVVA